MVHVKPRVFASKCFGFATCRYDGFAIYDHFIERLRSHAEFVTACPEIEIGLGVPRDPILITVHQGERKLKQPSTRRDLTSRMLRCTKRILDRLPEIDGFILKSHSPSCGIKDTDYFPDMDAIVALGKGAGFFGQAVLARFPKHPVEDEKRLRNPRVREHFLTRLFTLTRFRSTKRTMNSLIGFHSAHKLLLMAYSQKYLKMLGAIVANHDRLRSARVFTLYRANLLNALQKMPRYTSNINVLQHAYGHFRKKLKLKEKKHFLDTLERYRKTTVPLNVLLAVISSWIARFQEPYLAQQIFFQPYPEKLAEITHSIQNVI
jgi:uncharacterized protein YbgA (DUF1722 family)/uncharacterized protein YbbK (DUF523 family)